MKKKKAEGQMMQEAIDKASQLINLLQRENKDLKKRVQLLEKDCEKYKNEVLNLQYQNDHLTKKSHKNNDKIQQISKQLEDSRQAIRTMEQSLKKRIQNNKELHQKISNITAKLKEKAKDCQQYQTKLLSLQNQNQYLIKKLSEGDQKQNEIRQKISSTCSEREKQLKQAIRLKQAFSRRCEELKADNESLIQAAAEYKQKAFNKPVTVDYRPVKPIIVLEEPRLVPTPQSLLSKLVQKLGVKPEQTVQKQYDQVSSFIEYRLRHIQKLWQGIAKKVETIEWSRIDSLKDLHGAVQRVFVYLSELVSQAS